MFVLEHDDPGVELNGYEFAGETHAEAWMAQSWDPKARGFRVRRVPASELIPCGCPHCPVGRHVPQQRRRRSA